MQTILIYITYKAHELIEILTMFAHEQTMTVPLQWSPANSDSMLSSIFSEMLKSEKQMS